MPVAAFVRRLRLPFAGAGESVSGRQVRLSRSVARRSILWGFALFALVQVGFGIAAEWYPRLRDPLYGDKRVKLERRVTQFPDAPSVVMLGSSRTGLAFHGQRVEAILQEALGTKVVAFNYGIPASGPVTHRIYLERLLQQGLAPDLLLLEVLPSMLTTAGDPPLEKLWFFADRLTMSEREIVLRHGFDPAQVNERWAKSVLLPAYTLRFQIMSRISASWLPWPVRFDWSRGSDECGWGSMVQQQVDAGDRERGMARARAEYAAVLATLHFGGPAVEALREIVELCHAHGIPVKLVLMPESAEFRSMYTPDTEARLAAFVASFSAQTGVEIINAREWLPDSGFHDGHHMLTVGSEAFSDRLVREVILPQLSR